MIYENEHYEVFIGYSDYFKRNVFLIGNKQYRVVEHETPLESEAILIADSFNLMKQQRLDPNCKIKDETPVHTDWVNKLLN